MPARPPASPARFEEAVAWFRQRNPDLSDEEYAALKADAADRAFKVAGVAQLEMVSDVYRAVEKAIEDGTTLEDFQADAAEKLYDAWGARMPWRLETIFRTNVQNAYSAGRWEQMEDPSVKAVFNYRTFDALLDDRTTDICEHLNGVTLPADDPFWASHNPPLHFNCRSSVIALTEDQADKEAGPREAPDVDPEDGFGAAPGSDDWEPDLTGYPDPLREIAEAILSRAEKSSQR